MSSQSVIIGCNKSHTCIMALGCKRSQTSNKASLRKHSFLLARPQRRRARRNGCFRRLRVKLVAKYISARTYVENTPPLKGLLLLSMYFFLLPNKNNEICEKNILMEEALMASSCLRSMEKPPVKDKSIYFPLLYYFCHVFFLYDIQDKNDITLNHKSSFRLIA